MVAELGIVVSFSSPCPDQATTEEPSRMRPTTIEGMPALLARSAPRSERDPDLEAATASLAMNPVTGAFADPSHESAFAWTGGKAQKVLLPCLGLGGAAPACCKVQSATARSVTRHWRHPSPSASSGPFGIYRECSQYFLDFTFPTLIERLKTDRLPFLGCTPNNIECTRQT